jgi:hypothetical protein
MLVKSVSSGERRGKLILRIITDDPLKKVTSIKHYWTETISITAVTDWTARF